MGNDKNLVTTLQSAGEENGERIWELPLYDEYFEDLKSECADMKIRPMTATEARFGAPFS